MDALVSVLVYHYCAKTPDRNNLREEGFILAHIFRGFRSWLLSSIPWAKHHGGRWVWRRKLFTLLQTGSREKGRKLGARYNHQRQPLQTHLLKFPPSPKIALPTGDQALST
jgi:hypothetical protein